MFALIDAATGMRHNPIRYPDGAPKPLDGCRWCGLALADHNEPQWVASKKWHIWHKPTVRQIRARLVVEPGFRPTWLALEWLDGDEEARARASRSPEALCAYLDGKPDVSHHFSRDVFRRIDWLALCMVLAA